MNPLSEVVEQLARAYQAAPLLTLIAQTALSLLLMTLLGRLILNALRERSPDLAPGPLFLLSALLTSACCLGLVAYVRSTGRTLDVAMVEWLTGISNAPLEQLGPLRHPLVLGLLYMALYGVFVVVGLLLAWAMGLGKSQTGGALGEIESELGTSLMHRFYRLAGYRDPGAPEPRFVEWCAPTCRALRWAQFIALPAAVTGTLPPAVWVALAILIEGMALNLVQPPKPVAERDKADRSVGEAQVSYKDPDQLVRALTIDPRGPELEVRDGGMVPGNPEHLAQRTRIADESRMLADVLAALSIKRFYVHQEAASEALLSGKSVLMETPPLSGRRTLCDVLSLQAVLQEGHTVLVLSPDAEECARRARAFREVARRSGWRWAIHHHDLAGSGRRGLDLKSRQPQILFSTPEELHHDLCPNARDWDLFLGGLSLVVAIDLDRYAGAAAANLAFVFRRLLRAARRAGADPHVLATVAPYGPDVLGFCERVTATPLEVIGPESDSRGAPHQQILVALRRGARELHPAVGARGVAIACGYNAETWNFGSVLSRFEQEQQVNRVLLEFGKAVVSAGEDDHLRFDRADALVAHLTAEKAAMMGFFTRHVGRQAIETASSAAQEVGARRAQESQQAHPFVGFAGPEPEQGTETESAPDDLPEEAASEEPEVELRADRMVGIWLVDREPFAELLAEHPEWLRPGHLHPMLLAGSSLVAATDNVELAARHLRAAAGEAGLARDDAERLFSRRAVELALRNGMLAARPLARLAANGMIEPAQRLTSQGEHTALGSTLSTSSHEATLCDRNSGSVILRTDRARLAAVAYPGRVFVRHGRRYRVLFADEQPEGDGLLAEPERRRIETTRVRRLSLAHEVEGNELTLGGGTPVRFGHVRGELSEEVLGVRVSHEARDQYDEIRYDQPIVVRYPADAAVLALPGASPEALHALAHLTRAVLPAFVRHAEEDLDVDFIDGDGAALVIVDRHPTGAGFSRAITSDVIRHVLYWNRALVQRCQNDVSCIDGCARCVAGVPCRAPRNAPAPSRKKLAALLDAVLGPAAQADGSRAVLGK